MRLDACGCEVVPASVHVALQDLTAASFLPVLTQLHSLQLSIAPPPNTSPFHVQPLPSLPTLRFVVCFCRHRPSPWRHLDRPIRSFHRRRSPSSTFQSRNCRREITTTRLRLHQNTPTTNWLWSRQRRSKPNLSKRQTMASLITPIRTT